MKTAHLLRKYVPSEWGGTETAMQQLAIGLAGRKVKSVVFCPESQDGLRGNPKEPSNGNAVDPLTAAGCEIRPYHACLPVWGLSKVARHQAISLGGNLHSFDLPGKLTRERNVDIIHSHVVGRLGGIAQTIARRRHIPFILTIHGGVLDLSSQTLQSLKLPTRGTLEWGRILGWWWGSRRVLANADLVITCNHQEAGLLHQRYPALRIITHPHGIESGKFQIDHRETARTAFPGIRGRQVLLCVARIDVVKNQSWLIERIPQILHKHPQALIVLAGAATNQTYRDTLLRKVKALGLEKAVLFTGGLPPNDPRLLGLYQGARAMVLPSQAEPFGLVILEAWAAGTPVLASRTSGARSLIKDGENGWLFELEDAGDFHAKLDRTLTDPGQAAALRGAATRLVREKYDAHKLASEIKDIYTQLIANSRRKASCHSNGATNGTGNAG